MRIRRPLPRHQPHVKSNRSPQKSSQQDISHLVNAGEIAAFTAVIAAGFLFSRFCFLIRERGLLLAKNEALDVYTMALAKITHSIEFVAAFIALFSVIFAFFSAVVKPDLDRLKGKWETNRLQSKKISKKDSKIKYFIGACGAGLAAVIVFAFRVKLLQVSPDIQSYILLALLFVMAIILIVRGKLTTLAFYSASYLAFCTLQTFIYLAVTKH